MPTLTTMTPQAAMTLSAVTFAQAPPPAQVVVKSARSYTMEYAILLLAVGVALYAVVRPSRRQ